MSATIKPIRLWGQGGPNPSKIRLFLHELGVPVEVLPLPITQVKDPKYVALNPNGRVPTIQDPNTGITLWETGAIIEYLIATYDKEHRLSFPAGSVEDWRARQFLYYQVSGQGPYFGQAIVFDKYHWERLPSAKERFVREINRVTGVLDAVLESNRDKSGDGPWLVGGKKTYADLAFVPWQWSIAAYLPKEEFDTDRYPFVKEWMGKMTEADEVRAILLKGRPGNQDPWEGFEKYGL